MDQALIFGRFLFWLLAVVTAFAPLRWAVPCYLLLAQIDFSGPVLSSASTFGFENTLKIVAVPTLLALRIGWKYCEALNWEPLEKSWLLFCSYVVVASYWSPFHLSALKMVGYLYAYTVLFLVFTYAWAKGWFTPRVLAGILFIALIFAVIQTYRLGNLFGFGGTENRFATFADAETFAAFLASMLSLFLFCGGRGTMRVLCILACLVGIVLTGSRYVFLGLMFLFFIASVFYVLRTKPNIGLRSLVKPFLLALVPTVLLVGAIVEFVPSNRLTDLFTLRHVVDVQDVGTFGFRLAIYGQAITELSQRNVSQLVFGSGTSSSGQVVIDLWPAAYNSDDVDGNRSMHDEFLRALYDWGFIGLCLLVWFLIALGKSSLNLFQQKKTLGALAFLGLFPTILIGLAVGNVLAEAGFPGGTGFVCVLACAAASRYGALAQSKNLLNVAQPSPTGSA